MPTKPNKIDKELSEKIHAFMKRKYKGKEVHRRTLVFYGHPFNDSNLIDVLEREFSDIKLNVHASAQVLDGKNTGLAETETYMIKIFEGLDKMTVMTVTFVRDYDYNDGCIFVKVGELDD